MDGIDNLASPGSGRFFDGGSFDDTQPPSFDKPPEIVLRRTMVSVQRRLLWWRWTRKTELFRLNRRIGYRLHGSADVYLVPAHEQFVTDLTSVPTLFTWLVPRTGSHLPAALLHDALVHDPRSPERQGKEPSYIGPPVRRDRADEIFREAMGDLGTSAVRRWLMWTAVSLLTLLKGVGNTGLKRAYYRLVVVATLLAIVCLGVLATIDLADKSGVWGLPELWWMAERDCWPEVRNGVGMAIVIPVALSVFWGRFWRAGVIAGVSLAVLLHVTLVLTALTLLFLLVERLMRLISRLLAGLLAFVRRGFRPPSVR